VKTPAAALSTLAAVREEGELRVVAFDREVRFVPGQSPAVSLRRADLKDEFQC
jgi:hypothetical protein